MTIQRPRVQMGNDDDEDPDRWGDKDRAYIYLRDDKLLDNHAEIYLLASGAFIVDEYSQNGTKVNGKMVRTPVQVNAGDVITLGKSSVAVKSIDLTGEAAPSEDTARYASITLMEKCSACGAGLPINGPMLTVPCGHCGHETKLKPEFYESVLEDVEADEDGEGGSWTINFSTQIKWRESRPDCVKCNTPLPVDDIAVGTDGEAFCPACGHGNTTFPAPPWLKHKLPAASQIYCADREGVPGSGGMPAVDPNKPMLLACPQCKAGLNVTSSSERTVQCEYCGSSVYLPDDVWKTLHPVRTAQIWYMRFDGAGKKLKEAEDEVQEKFDEVASRLRANPPRKPGSQIVNHIWILGVAVGVIGAGVGIVAAVFEECDIQLLDEKWERHGTETVEAEIQDIPFAIDIPTDLVDRGGTSSQLWESPPGEGARLGVTVEPVDTLPGSPDDARAQAASASRRVRPNPIKELDDGWVLVYRHPEDDWVESVAYKALPASDDGPAALMCSARLGKENDQSITEPEDATAYTIEICASLAPR